MSEAELSEHESDGEPQSKHIKVSAKRDSDEEREIQSSDGEAAPAEQSEDDDLQRKAVSDDSNPSTDDDDEPKPKKSKKKRSKRDNEGSDDENKVDKEILQLVKEITKPKTRNQYIARSKDPSVWEEQAKAIIDKMKEALLSDAESYQKRKQPFAKKKYLKELKGHLNNQKLAKYLLRQNLLDFFATWLSPYERRPGDPPNKSLVYPSDDFIIEIMKILLKLKIKPEYFTEHDTKIFEMLHTIPVQPNSELANLIDQVDTKFMRVVVGANEVEPGERNFVIDKEEAAEIKRGTQNEADNSSWKEERLIEKRLNEKYRKSTNADRPKDYKPPPRIIHKSIKPPKRHF